MVKLIDTQAQMRRGTGYWDTGRKIRKGDATRFCAIEGGTLALEPVDTPPVVEVAPVAQPAGRTGRLIGLTAADLDLIGTAPATAAFFAA